MYKNFSVIFPGCVLQHKKGNSRFPFLEEHAVHISYRLLKMHNKIKSINSNKHIFVCMCNLPPLHMLFT